MSTSFQLQNLTRLKAFQSFEESGFCVLSHCQLPTNKWVAQQTYQLNLFRGKKKKVKWCTAFTIESILYTWKCKKYIPADVTLPVFSLSSCIHWQHYEFARWGILIDYIVEEALHEVSSGMQNDKVYRT